MNFLGKNNFFDRTLSSQDPEIFNSLERELDRQRNEIELIASENIASTAVMEAQGSVMTNKYAEGYPGKRYYGGCENVDVAEQLAIDRLKELFNCSLCLGFWSGLIIGLSMFFFKEGNILYLLFPLCSSALSWFFDSLLDLIQLACCKLDK